MILLHTLITLAVTYPVQMEVVVDVLGNYCELVQQGLVGVAVYPVPSLEVDLGGDLRGEAGDEFGLVVVELGAELGGKYPGESLESRAYWMF